MGLRHIGHFARPLFDGQTVYLSPIQRDGSASRPQQPQHDLEQRAFSASIGPQQRQDPAARDGKRQAVQHRAVSIRERHLMHLEGGHDNHPARTWRSTRMKTGMPISSVATPIGTSTLKAARATSSTINKNPAPSSALVGSNSRLSGPTRSRATCGITNPTHAIMPAILTVNALTNVALRMTTARITGTLTPKVSASSSPMLKA